jgi:ATP-dependent RNA helicase RhlE
MSFTELGLRAEILRAIAEEGYTEPTPIQAKAIPVVLAGRDLMAAAQTGTGKTAGFTLPILQLLSTKPAAARGKPRVLVLTPTRELAAQVEESVRTYGHFLPLKTALVFGGVGIGPQIKALKGGVDILVATPGRLLDHVGQRTVDLSGIEILVLDEADRMLDMGFIHDIKKVLALVPKQKQTLLFSATFSDEIRGLANGLLRDPQLVEVAPRNATADLVSQRVYPVDKAKKRELLIKLIDDHHWHQVLVFTRTKHGANTLAEKLNKADISAAAIHGNKSQGARTRALADFKSMKLNVLVATDIAARGLDIDQLPHVVNFELPNVPEDYVHRIGRTGRAGSSRPRRLAGLRRRARPAARHRAPAEETDREDRAARLRARSEHPRGADRERQARPGTAAAALGRQPARTAVQGRAATFGQAAATRRSGARQCRPAPFRLARPLK